MPTPTNEHRLLPTSPGVHPTADVAPDRTLSDDNWSTRRSNRRPGRPSSDVMSTRCSAGGRASRDGIRIAALRPYAICRAADIVIRQG
jgi:hypothetical protein